MDYPDVNFTNLTKNFWVIDNKKKEVVQLTDNGSIVFLCKKREKSLEKTGLKNDQGDGSMKKMKIVYLPLDERPCNYAFAAQIADGTPITLIRPDMEQMGYKKIPADPARMGDFLLKNAADADALVLSLDMLLYGGIIPSRLHQDSRETLIKRLSLLNTLKERNPGLKIFAFALIMRCPCYSSADEEPDYYEHCGREIFLSGQVIHKRELGLLSEREAEKLLALYGEKTGPWLQDFVQRRQLNRSVLEEILLHYRPLFDGFVIPQDDSAEYGFTTMDREYLTALCKNNDLPPVSMYPGADEAGMSMLAQAACCLMRRWPKVYCDFAHPDSPGVKPVYEDRPVGKTLPMLLGASGCSIAQGEADADIFLHLNYPAKDPVEVWDPPTEGYAMRDLESFCQRIYDNIKMGRVTAVADGAFGNGGDAEFAKLLQQKLPLTELSAYAGWNTSSNTLGTAVCQAVFVWLFGHSPQQERFIAQRLYEDIGYCGYVRRLVTGMLPPMGYDYFNAGEKDGVVAALVRKNLEAYMQENFPGVAGSYYLDRCQMPWKRMFEIDLTLGEKA